MSVDIYGKCGTLQLGEHMTVVLRGKYDKNEFDQKMEEYMFYLAFENIICEYRTHSPTKS